MTLIVLEPGATEADDWRVAFFTRDETDVRLCSQVWCSSAKAVALVRNFNGYVREHPRQPTSP